MKPTWPLPRNKTSPDLSLWVHLLPPGLWYTSLLSLRSSVSSHSSVPTAEYLRPPVTLHLHWQRTWRAAAIWTSSLTTVSNESKIKGLEHQCTLQSLAFSNQKGDRCPRSYGTTNLLQCLSKSNKTGSTTRRSLQWQILLHVQYHSNPPILTCSKRV